ncbi:glycosyltransferase [Fibrobacter sp. UWP2]|uniref:glycosyltransferase n=1 Tax=Fibrobacter sp. UWP2 TaxID=1896216 RepID=UPI00091521A4|nr:glycosyltransferase [Fibrobacter sp. UWP2]SHJ34359.1 Glycosyltransferase involved in cell wall bisynthesis [Fibrobacter sp. UWP2]
MNILYISNLSGNLWAGPNNSVPAQIRAQAKIDNVFWFNINHSKRKEWTQDGLDCKNLDDFPSGRLRDLPAPFNRPDIVVVEEFYCFPFCKLIADVQKQKIPYVIIPRSEMTVLAQKNKKWKKRVGNMLYFKKMAKKASGIQFLTEKEKIDSGDNWNKECFVIPNGIDLPEKQKKDFSVDGINASYIGRIEIYQKGLDLLLDAINDLKDDLLNNSFQLTIYGPNRDGALEFLRRKIQDNFLEDIVSFNEGVFGQEKIDTLLDSDVFIMTSRFEGMPMGLIEALSYGIPCLVTKGTNLADEVRSADAGWIAENSVLSIKDALRTIIFTRNFTEKGKNALSLSKTYSWNEIAKQSSSFYKKIIEK